MFSQLYTAIFLQPILNLLIWLYSVIPGQEFGIAIIVLTILIKIILYPFTAKQIKQQRAMQEIQPRIEEIRKRLKDDKEAQAKELMALYAKEKVNPAASCLPLLVQLPVFIALYRALSLGLAGTTLTLLYSFVPNPQTVNTMFLGLIDLSNPSPVLAILAAAVQFWQGKQLMKPPAATITAPPVEVEKSPGAKDEGMAAMMNKQMLYLMPIVTAVIGFSLPGGLTLYWLTMSLLTVAQQALLLRRLPPRMVPQLSGRDQTPPLDSAQQ